LSLTLAENDDVVALNYG